MMYLINGINLIQFTSFTQVVTFGRHDEMEYMRTLLRMIIINGFVPHGGNRMSLRIVHKVTNLVILLNSGSRNKNDIIYDLNDKAAFNNN